MVQDIVVAVIVALAACYAIWRWMPAGWRHAAAARFAAGTLRAGLVDAERASGLAARLGRSSGCGSCDSCGGCGPKGDRTAHAPQPPATPAR